MGPRGRQCGKALGQDVDAATHSESGGIGTCTPGISGHQVVALQIHGFLLIVAMISGTEQLSLLGFPVKGLRSVIRACRE